MDDIDIREGWGQLCKGFSNEGREVCRALDYNETAFTSDLNFLLELAGELYREKSSILRWKFEEEYISRVGM